MRKILLLVITISFILSLYGCANLSLSSNTSEKHSKENSVEIDDIGISSESDYELFSAEDVDNNDYFEEYLYDSRKIHPSEMISDRVDHVVYVFECKNAKPEICWYDSNNLEIEYLSYFDGTTRYIHTADYHNESLPKENTQGDTLEYREPATEHSGYCIYDDNGRIITEFSDQADNSSELYEYSYRQDGKLQRKTYIEIDYYSIDWNYPVNDSEFLEDEAYEAVFDSVHLDYDYDDYIYDSKDLLIRIDSYSAGDINPRYYTIFEYDSDNRIIKSFDGWYNKDTIERIMIYEYY